MCRIEQLEDGNILVKVPMSLRLFAGRKRIITPGMLDRPPKEQMDNAVLCAFARAQHWQRLIDEGKFKSGSAIAKELGVDSSYVTRILRLNQISPRIVRLFLTGMAPDGLSLTKLIRQLPETWEEQEQILLS